MLLASDPWAAVGAVGTVLGALGTVAAFFVLIAQTRSLGEQTKTLRGQLEDERRNRKQDEHRQAQVDDQRAADYERSVTPFITLEGHGHLAYGGPGNPFVGMADIHADGAGVAINVNVNLQRSTEDGQPGPHVTTSIPVPFMRAGDSKVASFTCPLEMEKDFPLTIWITGTFQNQLGNLMQFRQSAKLDKKGLHFRAAPEYVWPWDGHC